MKPLLLAFGYSPEQPRHPKGDPLGGQWSGGSEYPRAGEEVDGRTVLGRVPNLPSIEASLLEYEIVPGIREVPTSALDPEFLSSFADPSFVPGHSKDEKDRHISLRDAIKESREISPLIVVIDKKGPYILEGGHRIGALLMLGAKSFPAKVVIDTESAGTDPSRWNWKFTPEKKENAVAEVLAFADAEKEVLEVLPFAAMRPLYVRRQVLNAEDIVAWAKGQGFATTLPAGDMHVTVCFSKEPVNWNAAGRRGDPMDVWFGERRLLALGPEQKAVVLQFESEELHQRWEEFLSAGASWDWAEYHPHITITYDKPADLPLAAVKPFDGNICLGPEIFETLEEDWADSIKEHADSWTDAEGCVWRMIRGNPVCLKGKDGKKPPANMTATEINKELDKLDIESSRLNQWLIDEGRGHEKPSDYLKKTDPLSTRIRGVYDRTSALRGEVSLRYGPGAPSRLPIERGSFGPRVKEQEKKEHSLLREIYFAEIKSTLDLLEAQAKADLRGVLKEWRDALSARIAKAAAGAGLQKLAGELRLPRRGDFTAAMLEALRRAWERGSKDARAEVQAARRRPRAFAEPVSFVPRDALRWLGEKAFWITNVTGDRLLGEVQGALLAAIKTGLPLGDTIARIVEIFEPYIGDPDVIQDEEQMQPYRLETIIRTNTTEAYNHGRLTQFVKEEMLPFLNGVRYSAVLDERTTEVCRFLDGKVFQPGTSDLEQLLPPNHFNCRSIVVPVVVGEEVAASDFITPEEVGRAKGLADQKFLSLRAQARGAAYNPGWETPPKPEAPVEETVTMDIQKTGEGRFRVVRTKRS